jgi:hypothetical protein
MKKVSGSFAPLDLRGKNRERGREREGGEGTEKKIMEKEGLKKGKGNWEARR